MKKLKTYSVLWDPKAQNVAWIHSAAVHTKSGVENKQKLNAWFLVRRQTHLSVTVTVKAAAPIRLWNKRWFLWQIMPLSLCPFLFSLSQLDQSVISGIATGHPEASNKSLIRKWCRILTNAVCPKHFCCTQNILKDFNPDFQTVSVLLRP